MARKRVTIPLALLVLAAIAGSAGYLLYPIQSSSPPPAPTPDSPAAPTDTPGSTPSADAAVETIKIASWNILNLGARTPLRERAEVIAQYDIVALQEVESFEGLERLRVEVERVSGVPWAEVHSPMVGEGRAAEAYAFIHRTDRVVVSDGPKGVYPEPSPTDFSREPFFATFRDGSFDFTLVTVHVTFGAASERTAEVERLAEVWQHVQDADLVENDILLMGDFNRNKPTHRAFNPLEEIGATPLITGDGVFTSYSTKTDRVGANLYDGIWLDPAHTSAEFTGTSGVDLLHERYYLDAEHPHLAVRKKLSDHCPVWAEFSVVGDDDD